MNQDFQKQLWQALKISACLFLFLITWIIAVPFVFRYLKKTPVRLRFALTFIFLISIALLGGAFTLWLTLIPIISTELAILIQKNSKRVFTNINFQYWPDRIFILTAFVAFHLGLLIFIEFYFFKEFYLELEIWLSKINEYLLLDASKSLSPAEATLSVQKRWGYIVTYVPSIYFGSFIIAFISCYWRSLSLKALKWPDYLFWLTLISFCVGFIDIAQILDLIHVPFSFSPEIKLYSSRLFAVLACLYFFQGLSVLTYILEKLKFTRFWQNMWYILIIFNLPVGLILVGVTDFLFEYRSFGEKKWK